MFPGNDLLYKGNGYHVLGENLSLTGELLKYQVIFSELSYNRNEDTP